MSVYKKTVTHPKRLKTKVKHMQARSVMTFPTQASQRKYYTQGDGLVLVRSFARKGLSYRQIALKLNITERTLENWRKNYKEFSHALLLGKEEADATVEDSVYRLATGQVEKTSKVYVNEYDKHGKPTGRQILVKKTVNNDGPDLKAANTWLTNRDSKHWKNKQSVEVGSDTSSLQRQMDKLDANKLKELIQSAKAQPIIDVDEKDLKK